MDQVAALDDDASARGCADGTEAGRQDGWLEGRSLGIEKGFEIGHQLGYLSGCLSGIEAMGKADSDFLNARSQKLLTEAIEHLQRFPCASPQDPALQGALDELQAKFKALIASLGALPEFLSREQPTLEF